MIHENHTETFKISFQSRGTYDDEVKMADLVKNGVQNSTGLYVPQMLPLFGFPHLSVIVRSYLRNPQGPEFQTQAVQHVNHSSDYGHMDTALQQMEQLAHWMTSH